MVLNARAILPDTSNVPLDLSCVTIARRDFMIGLSSFYSFVSVVGDEMPHLLFPQKTKDNKTKKAVAQRSRIGKMYKK